MANPIIELVITGDSHEAVASTDYDLFANAAVAAEREAFIRNLINYLEKCSSGAAAMSVIARMENGTNVTKSSATLTVSGTPVDGETITIGGKVLTFVAASANENEITIDADNTVQAGNIVAIVNANSVLKGLVLASNVAGVVTIACVVPGRIGNIITLAEAATGVAASAAVLSGATATQQRAPITYTFGGV